MSGGAGRRRAFGRRGFVRVCAGGMLGAGSGLLAGCGAKGGGTVDRARAHGVPPAGPAAAWRELAAGNERWRTLHEQHPGESRAVRRSLLGGQHPFAVVLGCIDSRVPPELVFDQGLGDLLTVRSAGEVLDEAVLGSISYGVLELAVPLVVVLGHQGCGAVRAAAEADRDADRLPVHVRYLAQQIRPVLDRTLTGDARVDAAVTANVRRITARLTAEPDLAVRIAAGTLNVIGARYELTSQRVHRIH
ncbi:carbonic anhydrase [Streptomyces bambusae]|uniref:carbonic anhydrase n=1 Tax=Streptomyces bambusae TaxID=1550616 RepID=UPI001CFF6F32|nr:carbonic anhydrase [Streptomyces bambusae]MCB5169492.1 carbonic anhydrase [Streptomyces bambusae]